MISLEKILEKLRWPLLSAGLVLTGISCYTSDPKDYVGYYLDHPPQTNKKYSAPLVNPPVRSNSLVPANSPETPGASVALGDLRTFKDYIEKHGWAEVDDKIKWYDLLQKMNVQIEENSNDAFAYLERAKAEINLKMLDECTKDCDIALRLKNITPTLGSSESRLDSALYCCMYVWDWILLAKTEANYLKSADAKQKFGLYEEAAKAYKKAIAINPNNSEAKKGLEFCLKQTGEPSKEKTSSKDEDM